MTIGTQTEPGSRGTGPMFTERHRKTMNKSRDVLRSLVISFAVYPIVLLGVLGLIALGIFADKSQLPVDTMPLVYGLVFAALTFFLIDLLGIASVVPALLSGVNLIEYAQLIIPGRSASLIDLIAGLSGVVVTAVLIWVAHSLVRRSNRSIVKPAEKMRL